MADVIIRRAGAAKPDPFTIVVVANPALETPWRSGMFAADPILSNRPAFDAATQYVEDCLFAVVPGIKERLLNDPAIDPHVRMISVWDSAAAVSAANALVGLDGVSNTLIARRREMQAFVSRYTVGGEPLAADIIYGVSNSESHNRASAWFTSDDDSRPGVPFSLDTIPLAHRYYNLIPGTIAIHQSARDLTALHEFQHAISSYTNGSVVDLYVDSSPGLNCKNGRPIPSNFGSYRGISYLADSTRNSLGYPAGWSSYHCELINPSFPAVMDDYYSASTGNPLDCQNDQITRVFVLDRIKAKLAR
jgi:hypothetical protein